MSDNRPIGIFDSGLGGLTVVREIIKFLPNEDLIYLGDTARVPYGTRSKETIIKFSFEDANFLLKQNVKCIVIACNTASSQAGDILKKRLKIPVFEVITSAAKDAVSLTKNGKIGVIGTRGTIGSKAYQKKIKNLNSKLKVFANACPLFVSFIEEGETTGPALQLIAKKYLSGLKKQNIDTLILGCTHYPIIGEVIKQEVDSNKVKLIDPGNSEAKSVKKYLTENKILTSSEKSGKREYFVTDLTDRFTKVAEMFLGHSIDGKVKKVVIDQ